MVRKWGAGSWKQYVTLHPILQHYLNRVLDEVADISIIKGYRSAVEQNEAFRTEHSKVRWPNSKHNAFPSLAVDIQPYPRPEREDHLEQSLAYIAGAMCQMAREDGITLRWGGDWDKDGEILDEKFRDLFHIEIEDKENAEAAFDRLDSCWRIRVAGWDKPEGYIPPI